MRVLVVSTIEPGFTDDGVSLVLHHHLAEWRRRHDVVVLAASTTPGLRTDPDGTRVWGRQRGAAVDYVSRRARGLLTRTPSHVLFVERPELLTAVDEQLRVQRPEAVHLFGWGTARIAARVRAQSTARITHMPIDHWGTGLRNRHLPWWRRVTDAGEARAVRRHERTAYSAADAVVLVTPRDAALVAADSPGARVVVVPNGVAAGPEPAALPGTSAVGLHGAMGVRANAEAASALVHDVLPRVRRQGVDVTARIIGRDPSAEVLALAGPGVVVTGSVPDVRAELEQLQVYVAPLWSGTGIKNKVLEAMAAGRPVVTSPLGVEGIGAGDGIEVAATASSMADAVAGLLRDPGRAAAIGAAGRARVLRERTWARSAEEVERLWRP